MKIHKLDGIKEVLKAAAMHEVNESLEKEFMGYLTEGADPSKDNSEYLSAVCCALPQKTIWALRDEFKALSGKPIEDAYEFVDKFIAEVKENGATEKVTILATNGDKAKAALERTSDAGRILTLNDIAVGLSVAVSSTRFVKHHVSSLETPDEVIWGNPKGKDSLAVSKFFTDTDFMKDYNSSDIVIRVGDKYFGISIKKKTREKASNPTVANNKLQGFVKNFAKDGKSVELKLQQLFDEEFEKCWAGFFNGPAKEAVKTILSDMNVSDDSLTAKDTFNYIMKWNKKMKLAAKKGDKSAEEKRHALYKDAIEAQSNEWQCTHPSMLIKIAELIQTNSDAYVERLIDACFRTQLKEFEKNQFYFALAQGIGSYEKQAKCGKAICVDSRLITFSNLQDYIGDIENVENYELQFDEKSTFKAGTEDNPILNSAGIKFTLAIKKTGKPICDITFRWKGFDTKDNLPILQAYFRNDFEHVLKDM